MISKKEIRELSSQGIINMSRLMRKMGHDNIAEVYTRLGRPNASMPGENFYRRFEIELMETISEIVKITGMDLTELVPRLIADQGTHLHQLALLENMQVQQIDPVAYWHHRDGIIAIYLQADAYRARHSDHDSRTQFMTPSQFMRVDESKGQLELTPRGKSVVAKLMQQADIESQD